MIGTTVGGYLIEQELGQGGFGTAYLATRTGQRFVVKFLRPDAATVTMERFRREVRSLQKVNHELVVGYVDHGEVPGPTGMRKYLVMPFVPGSTLFQTLQAEPVWSPDRVIALARDVLEALTAVHGQDIVHRDIKPTNIWLRTDRRAVLLDFGIAKLMDYTSITQGFAPLTWRYASPEQALDTVDGRSDLYSLGAVMYELLTGRPVFDGADPFTFLKRLREDMPDLPSYHNPDVPAPLENVVMRLLAKQPYQRPRTAAEVAQLLDEVVASKRVPPSSTADLGLGPRHYVHAQHNEAEPLRLFLHQGGRLSGVVYGASQLDSSGSVPGVAIASKVPLIIDPETHRLARSDFSRTAGLRSLPWVGDPMNPIRPTDLQSVEAFKKLARDVVGFQEDREASVVFAPYYHFIDLTSDWLKINQKLLAESREALIAVGSDRELFAVISTDVETICDDDARRTLLNLYTRTEVDGYWFLINFDDLTASPAELFNYARLVLEFRQTGRSVVAARVGSFGLGLMAAGCTGFSAGMTTLENFSWNYFTDRSKMGGGQQRYFVSQLLQNVPVPVAQQILGGSMAGEFACACAGCSGRLRDRTAWLAARLHVLHARQQQVEALMRTPVADRVAWFQSIVEEAGRLALRLDQHGVQVRREHFERWLAVLDQLVKRGLIKAA